MSAVTEVSAMNQQVSVSAEAQRVATEGISADLQLVNQSAQFAVELSHRIMQAAAQADDVAKTLESTIMRFRTGDGRAQEGAIQLF